MVNAGIEDFFISRAVSVVKYLQVLPLYSQHTPRCISPSCLCSKSQFIRCVSVKLGLLNLLFNLFKSTQKLRRILVLIVFFEKSFSLREQLLRIKYIFKFQMTRLLDYSPGTELGSASDVSCLQMSRKRHWAFLPCEIIFQVYLGIQLLSGLASRQ